MYLFVYGSLLKGKEAHFLLKSAKFIDNGAINGILYDLGVGFPGLIEDNNRKVWGEIYEISPELLIELDEYEGYYADNIKDSMFIRKKANVVSNKEAREYINVYVYYLNPLFLDKFSYSLVEEGKWN